MGDSTGATTNRVTVQTYGAARRAGKAPDDHLWARDTSNATYAAPHHGALTAQAPELGGAADAAALDGRPALLDLTAPSALDQRHLQPLRRSLGTGERDLVVGDTEPIQYTTGSARCTLIDFDVVPS